MNIETIRIQHRDERTELSAQLGDFRCVFLLPPGTPVEASGDPFLAAGLIASMARGEPLVLDPEFSAAPTLLDGLIRLQEIFSVWVPELTRVRVEARAAPPRPPRPEVATLFSGGVDSIYTLFENPDVSRALHIRGFDYRRDRRDLAEEIDRRNRKFIESHGVGLVLVESNLRDLYDAIGVHPILYHGSHLASVGLAVGFRRIYVPASFTWADLMPWGSHPVTDVLWSNGAVEFVPHGVDAGRLVKLRRIGSDPEALGVLRVCPGYDRYSCGVCEKCLRTRVGLRLLGLSSPNLQPLRAPWRVARLRLDSERSRIFWSENWRLAREKGDRALRWAIGTSLLLYEIRRAVHAVDRHFFGGALLRGLRFLKRPFVGRPPAPRLTLDGPG